MCTCGIDIATQQAAGHAAAPAPGPASCRTGRCAPAAAQRRSATGVAAASGGRGRISGDRAAIARRRTRPVRGRSRASRRSHEVLHDRRPDRAAQVVPLAQIATAMPRWRTNHSDVSAIMARTSPRRRRDRSAGRARARTARCCSTSAAAAEAGAAPTNSGTLTPKRSASRPIACRRCRTRSSAACTEATRRRARRRSRSALPAARPARRYAGAAQRHQRERPPGASPRGGESGRCCIAVRTQAAGDRTRAGPVSEAWAARRSSVASSPSRAANCMPIGSPAAFQCSGTDIAGCPVAREERRERDVWSNIFLARAR